MNPKKELLWSLRVGIGFLEFRVSGQILGWVLPPLQ